MISITIDGKKIEVPEGTTILDAAKRLEIYIPALCHHPKITPSGSCRVCIVEVNGNILPSCITPVEENMVVVTNSPYIEELRRDLIDLILSDHPYDCMTCQKTGECELQELAYKYEIRKPLFYGERRAYSKKDNNPFIERDMEKCILCGRCVKICDEVQGVGAIDFAYKGFFTKVCPAFEDDLSCEFCGQCVMVCPTGALVGKEWLKKGRYWNVKKVDTVCPYCGVGCNITLHIKDNEVIRVTSKEDSVPNESLLCVKGRFAYEFISSPDRLRKPLIKKDDRFIEVTWDDALNYAAEELMRIKKAYGSDAIAGLSSARCTTEENYIFQKFMRAVIGTNNVDHCARL